MSTLTDRTDAMAAIEAMAERLRDEYGAEAVILYGSRADGSARPDSDVDLMIIKSDASSGMMSASKKCVPRCPTWRTLLRLDTRTYTPAEVESTLAEATISCRTSYLQGKVLHAGKNFARVH